MRFTYFFIFFILTFFACQNDPIPDRVTFQSTPLDSVYEDLRPEVQEFSISNNQPNKIKATKGTEIFVPQNSFVDVSGNPIKGKVEVKLIEAFSMEDFITSGLATQSNGQLLISNGMINIDASAGGETVDLAEGKELTVSMPTMKNNMEGFQMFTGDGQNWEVDSSMMEEEYLIPVPLELLYSHGDEYMYHCWSEDGKYKRDGFYDTTYLSLSNPKFENSLISTIEFRKRYLKLLDMIEAMSFLDQRDYYLGKEDCFGREFKLDIWRIYSESLNEPIEKLDSTVKQMYIQNFKDNKEAYLDFYEEVIEYQKELHSYNWKEDRVSIEKKYMSLIDAFPSNDKGKLKLINDHGVDLDSKDASIHLKEKGVPSMEINEILSYHFKRNAILNKLKREKEARDSHQAISEFYETTSFSVKKLGWINCDRFYDSPDAKEAKILASNSSKNDLNYIDFSLVFPKMNARLSASINEDGNYAFTQNGLYSKLPIGAKAIVTATSFQNDSIYFAAQPIVIEENMQVDLDLKLTSKEGLRDSLSVLF